LQHDLADFRDVV